MGLFFNFNKQKASRFPYRPMYYDERKERLEKMRVQAEIELGSASVNSSLQEGFLRESRESPRLFRNVLNKASLWRLLRLFIITIALLLLMYYLSPELFITFWTGK